MKVLKENSGQMPQNINLGKKMGDIILKAEAKKKKQKLTN